ncbi:hypothetical protein GCM10009745_13840 [Kribbella yunnanensis]|uniref:Uncharacterized protein n=1 Tax=Kribbella yunnanensis TaxID=190194 RepID=A0ABP4SFR5_9ACTN
MVCKGEVHVEEAAVDAQDGPSRRIYPLDELMPIARQLVTDHHDVICSAGPSKDFSGVGVMLWSDPATDHEELTAALGEEVGVPVVFERYVERG